jgi:autotransporter-associated beta strand protein
VLSGTNTYSGGTVISAGALQVTNTSSVGTGAVTLDGGAFQSGAAGLAFTNAFAINTTNGTIDTQANTLTLSGTIGNGNGAGALTKVGTGTLVLTGTDTYSGGTTISAGTLQLGSGSGGGTSGSIVGNVADSGTFVIGRSNNYTFGGTISGSGAFQQIGSGTTTLTGTNTYIGATSVTAGALEVNGSIASSSLTTVSNNTTLLGTGTVGNTQINTGGTLAPGVGTPATATMAVTGNLTFQTGATYTVQVNPSSATRTNVSGTATLNGTVSAVFATGNYVHKSYDILHSGGLNGTTFAGLVTTNLLPGFTASLSYVPTTDVLLNLNATLGSSGGLNGNALNVANGLNNFFNSGGTLPPNFFNLFGLTGGNLANALSQLSGEAATGGQQGVFQLTNQFLGVMLDPFADSGGCGGIRDSSVNGRGCGGDTAQAFAPDQQADFPPDLALAYASVLKAPPLPTVADQRWSTWGSVYGGSSATSGNAVIGSNKVTARTYGFASGMDYHVTPDTMFGFALAGGGTNWGLAQGLGGGRSDAFQAGVHGTTHFGPAYVGAALAFTNNWMTTNRVAFAGDQLTASFGAQSYGARLEAGYRYGLPIDGATFGVTPYAALQTQNFHTPSYSETDLSGGGFGLNYTAMTATDTRSEIGARFADLTALGTMPLMLRTRLAWAHDVVGNPALAAAFQALPGSSFTVFGAAPPKNSALTSAGAELHITPSLTFTAKVDGEFAAGSRTYTGSGTLRYTW